MTLQERRIEHINAWQASGLTQAVYCQQQGLNAKTFSRWFKTYQLSKQPTKPSLIPLEIKPHITRSLPQVSFYPAPIKDHK